MFDKKSSGSDRAKNTISENLTMDMLNKSGCNSTYFLVNRKIQLKFDEVKTDGSIKYIGNSGDLLLAWYINKSIKAVPNFVKSQLSKCDLTNSDGDDIEVKGYKNLPKGWTLLCEFFGPHISAEDSKAYLKKRGITLGEYKEYCLYLMNLLNENDIKNKISINKTFIPVKKYGNVENCVTIKSEAKIIDSYYLPRVSMDFKVISSTTVGYINPLKFNTVEDVKVKIKKDKPINQNIDKQRRPDFYNEITTLIERNLHIQNIDDLLLECKIINMGSASTEKRIVINNKSYFLRTKDKYSDRDRKMAKLFQMM